MPVVQVAAGTTYGNQALEVEDRDEQRLLLTAEKNGVKVEARLTKRAEENGKRSRDLGAKARNLPVGSPERQKREAEVEEILEWFRSAPGAELVSVEALR